ncbi:lysophospholipid acyltransferase family protein [Cognatishimia sp.]|uniref:lysophospholipid acyltransferase family protein n=1 Tax=Cognatishimia sp. TaxID=2211648 RepID=UPI0035132F11
MTPTWTGNEDYIAQRKPKGLDWLRVVRRGVPGVLVIAVCLVLLLIVRLVERPLFGQRRPITPYITCFVCRSVLWLIGFPYEIKGVPMSHPGAVVANHASWLDIFSLNAPQRIYFVSKSEVAGWPGIGVLAKATGTVFISRQRKEAKRQQDLFEQRLGAGHKLLFFPEGTSTDANRVLPFKTTLFEAFFSDALREQSYVQPISVNYHAPEGEDPRYYGWWGDMELVPNVLHILSTPKQGKIELVFHPPMAVSRFANRKALAATLEQNVREAHFSSQ